MRERCMYGSVRGARGNLRPYRDRLAQYFNIHRAIMAPLPTRGRCGELLLAVIALALRFTRNISSKEQSATFCTCVRVGKGAHKNLCPRID